jgi:hypothetical protein
MSKPRSCVFLCKVPKSFKPANAHVQPEEILGGKFLARRLSLDSAARFAEAYNLAHLPSTGEYRQRWAIAIAGLHRRYDQQPRGSRRGPAPAIVEAAQTEGGAS